MKYGIHGINAGVCADPATSIGLAQAAEQAGFDSVWTAEHVVLPDPQAPPSPAAPETPFLDPAVSLAHLAGLTKTILLGTGIIILPQRNPVVLAKELASVDVVSDGRLLFGIGVGYLEPEFEALGIPFERKGQRTDEYLDAIEALWTQPSPRFSGEMVSFSGIQAMPRPIRSPKPPIIIGGRSAGAFRRAVRRGDGWYGFALTPESTAECLAGLDRARSEVDRRADLSTLEISVTPRGRVTPEDVAAYEELGVDRLILQLLVPGKNPLELLEKAIAVLGIGSR